MKFYKAEFYQRSWTAARDILKKSELFGRRDFYRRPVGETSPVCSQDHGQWILFSVILTPTLPATTAVVGCYLSSLYSQLTLYRWCGLAYPYDWRGFFAGTKKMTSEVLLYPSQVDSGLHTTGTPYVGVLHSTYSRCNVISSPAGVSPTENSCMLHPFDKECPPAEQSVGEAGQTYPSFPCWRRLASFPWWCPPGSGHIDQGWLVQGTNRTWGATSKNFRSGTHRSGTNWPCILLHVCDSRGFAVLWGPHERKPLACSLLLV